MTAIFQVENVHCDNCAKRITSAIQAVQPGAAVDVRIDTGRVSVAPATDAEAIIKAIAGAGYQAKAA